MTEPKIDIRVAPWAESVELKNAITGALAEKGIDLAGLDLKGLGAMEIEDFLSPLINIVLTIDSNMRVQNALANCMKRCSYNGEMITEETFENVEAREYYYPIIVDILKVNLAPFFKRLLSESNLGSLIKAANPQ